LKSTEPNAGSDGHSRNEEGTEKVIAATNGISRSTVSEWDQGISQQLAEFVGSLTLDSIPQHILKKVKLHLLDSIGAALASASFDFARCAVDGLSLFEGGFSTVIGFPERLAMRDAALVNGILVHGLEFDDTSIFGRIHPSSSCMTAALGLAELLDKNGEDFLVSYAAGLECAIRLGAVAKGGFQQYGFHPTGVVATFAATLAAGRLLGLSPEKLTMAQGIAYSAAAGSQQFAADGAWTKRMHPGWAAVGGMTAAALARGGFTGPRMPYEGRVGFFKLYLGEGRSKADLNLATENLGRQWAIETLAIKPMPLCYFNVPIADAAIRLAKRHDIFPHDIDEILVFVPQAAVNLVCEPKQDKRRPHDAYAAQFSIYFTAATALTRRRFDIAELEEEALNDPTIAALAQRTEYVVDEKTTFPKFYSAAVRVRTRDGRVFEEREDIHRGSPEYPLTAHEVHEKFQSNANRTLDDERARQIIDVIETVEEHGSIRTLTGLLGLEDRQ
jgi:2-methylcitrate dehydratase PrpD